MATFGACAGNAANWDPRQGPPDDCGGLGSWGRGVAARTVKEMVADLQ